MCVRFVRYVEVRPNNTDIEVVLANAYMCLPESQWDSSSPSSAGIAGGGGGGGRAVVAHADLTLTQQWRGMPQVRKVFLFYLRLFRGAAC